MKPLAEERKIFTKTTLLILIPLVALVDVAAIMSFSQGLHPESNAEIFFLLLSGVFFIFSGVVLLKKKKKPEIVDDSTKEVDEPIGNIGNGNLGRF